MLQKSDKDPCTLCLKDVSTNSRWVHKRCIGISGTLKPDPTVRCKWCIGLTRPVDGRPITEVTVVTEKLDMVRSFCYPHVAVVNSHPSEDAVSHRANSNSKFNHLQRKKPFMHQECHAPCKKKTWAPDLVWSASPAGYTVTTKDQVSSQDHKARMQLDDLA